MVYTVKAGQALYNPSQQLGQKHSRCGAAGNLGKAGCVPSVRVIIDVSCKHGKRHESGSEEGAESSRVERDLRQACEQTLRQHTHVGRGQEPADTHNARLGREDSGLLWEELLIVVWHVGCNNAS